MEPALVFDATNETTGQETGRKDLAVELSTMPARRALVEYARRRRLRLDQLSDVLHLDDVDVPALVQRPRLPWHLADRIAVALGRHPYDMWPEWFDGVACTVDISGEEEGVIP